MLAASAAPGAADRRRRSSTASRSRSPGRRSCSASARSCSPRSLRRRDIANINPEEHRRWSPPDRRLPELELRPVGAADFPAYLATLRAAFHGSVMEDEAELEQAVFEPARSLAVFDGGAMVATAGVYSRELTVPGGPAPVAAVTFVGVRPTYRRRGLLNRLMRRQLAAVHAAGREAIAALWASEGRIYGRFGYAVASRAAELRVHAEGARLRTDPPLLPPRTGAATASPSPPSTRRRGRSAPGCSTAQRPGGTCASTTPKRNRARPPGAGPLTSSSSRTRTAPGRVRALAVRPRGDGGRPDGEVLVRELVARTPEAHAALWRHLLGLDLTSRMTWDLAPPDEPLGLMLDDFSAVRPSSGPACGSGWSTSAARSPSVPTPRRSTSCSRCTTTCAPGTPGAIGSPPTPAARCASRPPPRPTSRSGSTRSARRPRGAHAVGARRRRVLEERRRGALEAAGRASAATPSRGARRSFRTIRGRVRIPSRVGSRRTNEGARRDQEAVGHRRSSGGSGAGDRSGRRGASGPCDGEPGQTLRVSADPSGKLRFIPNRLSAKPGRVTIVMTNPKSPA